MIEKVETLIVGAGVIGSSVAMHLAQRGATGVRVIDFDLEGSLSSSELNAGGVRATWVHPLNIEMSKRSIEYFSIHAEDVGYRPCGYLWLHPRERWKGALRAREQQISQGWPVEVWDVQELQRRVPFIDKTEGIEGVLHAPRDGLINPNLLKNHYRAQAKQQGVVFDDRTLLREVSYSSEAGKKVQAVAEKFESVMSYESKVSVLTASAEHPFGRSKVDYEADRIINCAGPWAAQVAKLLGYLSPCFPVRRQVSIFDCKGLDLTPYGMIVDTSGVYFHPEATNGLAGFANSAEIKGSFNYSYDGESFFTELIWPALYERSSYFERLKHLTGWAGLYEVSPDESAILGEVVRSSSGGREVVFEAHSFSGHGVMHSYAAGLMLAERILDGKYMTVDGNPLSGSRFESNDLIEENLFI